MTILFFSSSGANTQAGIFIPIEDLPGITDPLELDSDEPQVSKQNKFLAAFLYKINQTLVTNRASNSSLLNILTGLGLDVTKSAPAGTGPNRFSQTFTCSYSQVVDNVEKEIYPIPVPGDGTNLNRGQLLVTSVFPGADALTASQNVTGPGVLIPDSSVLDYGGPISPINHEDDVQSRQWFIAMFRKLFAETIVRNTANNVVSAVTSKAQTAVVNATLPANATAATNPTTGLDPDSLPMLDIYSRNVSFTIEYEINEMTQTYDVRVA